jgi:hypothetical protein
MTSRRDFLKAAAIAPVAAPAAIKAAMEPTFAPGRLIDGSFMSASDIRALDGWLPATTLEGWKPLEMKSVDLKFVAPREFATDEICDAFEVERWQLSSAPNRLFGARINDDGDAI